MTYEETRKEMARIRKARTAELRAELANASDSFAAYWAGSASASVLRDYQAGRVVDV